MAALRESMSFLGQFLIRPTQVGAVAPSSRFLARALTRPLARQDKPVTILEIGAGTGAVTRQIATHFGPHDRLDICEANPRLAAHLQQELLDEGPLAEAALQGRVRLFAKTLQEVDELLEYDIIISGLPLTAFKLADVQGILTLIREKSKPDCTFSYFEYTAIRAILKRLRRGQTGREFRALSDYLDEWIARYQIGRDFVAINVPPAYARHWQFKD